MRCFARFQGVAVLALVLSACGGGGDSDQEPLTGERISVMALERQLEVDPVAADIQVRLPEPVVNKAWPQAGGYPDHAMYHLALGKTLSTQWEESVGDGTSGSRRLIAQPVVADGKVFVYDADLRVTAVNAENGDRVWRQRLESDDENRDTGIGGGIGYADGRVFVTSGFGYMVAFDAGTGEELWRAQVAVPFRGAPTISEGQVFAVTHDNQLYAFDAETGDSLWYHVGIAENAGVLGAASPAVSGQNVVSGFSSGELFALRVENGRVTWSDSLVRAERLTPLSSINDIDGMPVIDDERVYAVSHGGRMVAIDLTTGARVWERNIASLSTPWVAGDFIYVVTLDAKLVAIYRRSGQIKWIRQLQQYRDVGDSTGLIHWSGPVLAGNRLIVTSSHGYAVSVSPYDGEVLGAVDIPDNVFVPPVVADETLYILDDSATLYALR